MAETPTRATTRSVVPPLDVSAHMRGAGAGWYFDPEDRAVYRYWDGQRWTDRFADTLTSLPSVN
jgi:hypothetical protein